MELHLLFLRICLAIESTFLGILKTCFKKICNTELSKDIPGLSKRVKCQINLTDT